MDLDLWLDGRLVAHTVPRSRGKTAVIEYEASVAREMEPNTPLLSCSLLTPGPSEPHKARSFLEGLLPEGDALTTMAARVRGVQLAAAGALAETGDAIRLLAEYGRECAGAVVAVPRGQNYEPSAGRYLELDDEALGQILRELPAFPLGAQPELGIRMSLAGAQPKFLLARIGGRWHEPVDGAASTHIVKPTGRWSLSADNEAIVMRVAAEVGLTPVASWAEEMSGTRVFVAERYDRLVTEDGAVRRLHQEDMCQALGVRPKDKYTLGRPSKAIGRRLREFSDDPHDDLRSLFRQIAFRAIVGDEDGHGKNYSLLLADGSVRLAPLYDCLATLAYAELSGTMAAQIGHQQKLARIDRAALLDEAAALGISAADAGEILDRLHADVGAAIANLAPDFAAEQAMNTVTTIIGYRLGRLADGTPMGAAPAGALLSAGEARSGGGSVTAARPSGYRPDL